MLLFSASSLTGARRQHNCWPDIDFRHLEPVDSASAFVCVKPSLPIRRQPESLAEHVCLCVCVRRGTQMPLFNSYAFFPLSLAKHAPALDITQTQRSSAGEKARQLHSIILMTTGEKAHTLTSHRLRPSSATLLNKRRKKVQHFAFLGPCIGSPVLHTKHTRS